MELNDSAFKGVTVPNGYNPSTSSGYYGVTSPYAPSTQEQSSSPGSFDQITSLFDTNKLGSGSNSGGNGLFSGVRSGIDQFGSDYLGLGNGLGAVTSGGSIYGPTLPGATAEAFGPTAMGADGALGATSLSGVLQGAAFGAGIGGLLNSKNPVAGMIGGGLGGAVGSVALGGLTTGIGAALGGTQMGAAIGSILPGVGTVIGAVAGGLLSKAFGGKKPATKASSFAADALNPDGTFVNARVGSKGLGSEYGQQAQQEFGSLLTGASKALGIKFSNTTSFNSGINTLRSGGPQPGYIEVMGDGVAGPGTNKTAFFYDPNDQKAKNEAYKQALTLAASRSGYTDTAKIDEYFKNPTSANQSNSIKVAPKQSGPSQFEQFVINYKAQQNANAAPSSAPAASNA